MNSALKRLWRILKANASARANDDFLREFEQWEERLRRKMKLDDDFETRNDFCRAYEPPKQEPTRDEKIAGYYANLELPYGASLEEVRKAYRNLMKRYHPDKFSGDPEKQKTATEIAKGLNKAYRELEKHLQSRST
ncbi:MAG: J domain-containing protein [Chloroherpetonaceae bacterium]|nr:J domain-containing protein [Chloroherpetonaceae bacterium]MDW8438758.1 J domain-containing protein [Chloroherpetonaceae bacterium]